MEQEVFNQLYGNLYKFSYYNAGRYFSGKSQREEAAEAALNTAIDMWIKEWEETGRGNFEVTNCDLKKAKSRIRSTLRRLSRHQELEPIDLDEELDGFHAYQLKEG